VGTVNQFGCRRRTVNRAQSETAGAVLLLAMVVIGVSGVGYVLLGTIDPGDGPTTDVAATGTDDALTITHRGGEPLAGAAAGRPPPQAT
jgi:flagellin-like protein